MNVLAWRKPAPASSSFDPEDDEAEEDQFFVGERICTPPEETRGSFTLRIVVAILIAAGGWWLFRNADSWQGWLSKVETASALMEYRTPDPIKPAAATPDHTSPAEPAPSSDAAPTLAPTPSAMAAVDKTAPPPQPLKAIAAHEPTKEFSVSSLEPPATDPTDPFRARAVAAGLHPDLSRVLLARLSAADYSNARTAIDTAIAKTPDTGTFIWPRQRQPELALFQVRFVPGAAPDCRRYVVTITKDRWSTTAPPMERCGSGLGAGHK